MTRYIIISNSKRSNLYYIFDRECGKTLHVEQNYEQAEYLCNNLNKPRLARSFG